jgi:hypothetical protein
LSLDGKKVRHKEEAAYSSCALAGFSFFICVYLRLSAAKTLEHRC